MPTHAENVCLLGWIGSERSMGEAALLTLTGHRGRDSTGKRLLISLWSDQRH
jgi:hypothetical protein